MAKMPPRQRALRKVIRQQPASLRRLATAAGVKESNMRQAAAGQRRVSGGMARGVITALRQWAATCDRLADELEHALKGERCHPR